MRRYPYAFATYFFKDDSYLPGVILQAFELKKQKVIADLICIVTPDISDHALKIINCFYDYVFVFQPIELPSIFKQRRQYLPYVFTKLHALRMGTDGDLGLKYKKIAILDADLLPLKFYNHLFTVNAPAGILNECRDNFKTRTDGDFLNILHGRWYWHEIYSDLPHGQLIPAKITDKVKYDKSNYGINTALLLIEPDFNEYNLILEDLQTPQTLEKIEKKYYWPDMQYLTVRWSGKWHNIDLCFAGLNGYPSIDMLFGLHYAGIKPWQINNKSIQTKYCYFADYQFWYREFVSLYEDAALLSSNKKLSEIFRFAVSRIAEYFPSVNKKVF